MAILPAVVFAAAAIAGATAIIRALRSGAVVLCYHNIVDREVTGADVGLHMPVSEFERQIQWLADHFTIVSLDELRARAESGRTLRGCAAVTFDDGYRGTIQHGLKVLRSVGAHSTVFVPSAAPSSGDPFWWDQAAGADALSDAERSQYFVEELGGDSAVIRAELDPVERPDAQCLPATWDQLRASVSDLVALGAHSVSHRTLTHLDDRALAHELTECRRVIRAETDVDARWFAYPYGRWNPRVAAAVKQCGYAGAWTLEGHDVSRRCDWFGAPRINIPAGIKFASFEAWVSGFAHLRARVRS